MKILHANDIQRRLEMGCGLELSSEELHGSHGGCCGCNYQQLGASDEFGGNAPRTTPFQSVRVGARTWNKVLVRWQNAGVVLG